MASTITTSVVSGGSNSHATSSAEINAPASDFVSPGVNGTVSLNSGSGGTGSFCVNAQGTPAMLVDLKAGSAYIRATPSGQVSQVLRPYMSADYTSYAISANASGSTKYDWIYLSVDATKANNPASDASDVTAVFTSRSSSNTTDNGTPPTYGVLLAVVTVANGASSITNSNISDRRTNSSLTTAATNTYFYDFIESGCIWTADSAGVTLLASMTSGVVWIGGKRLTVAAVAGRTFTASRDTYVDFSDNNDGTAAVSYSLSTTNAASQALATGAVRNAIVVTGAGSIAAAASINQGQEDRVLPIASSIAYSVIDSLGNLICPRDPNRKILGYKQNTAGQSGIGQTATQVTGLSCPVIVPTGRKVKITAFTLGVYSITTNNTITLSIWDGVVNSGTQIGGAEVYVNAVGGFPIAATASIVVTPSTTSKTYNVGLKIVSAGTATIDASSVAPAFILVELA